MVGGRRGAANAAGLRVFVSREIVARVSCLACALCLVPAYDVLCALVLVCAPVLAYLRELILARTKMRRDRTLTR